MWATSLFGLLGQRWSCSILSGSFITIVSRIPRSKQHADSLTQLVQNSCSTDVPSDRPPFNFRPHRHSGSIWRMVACSVHNEKRATEYSGLSSLRLVSRLSRLCVCGPCTVRTYWLSAVVHLRWKLKWNQLDVAWALLGVWDDTWWYGVATVKC